MPDKLMVMADWEGAASQLAIAFKSNESYYGFRHGNGANVLHSDWHVQSWSKDEFPRNSKHGSDTEFGAFYWARNTSGNDYNND